MTMLFLSIVALGITVTASSPLTNPAPNPAAVVLSSSKHARFTILSPDLIRMQYSRDGIFSDAPTLAIVNRLLPLPPFAVNTTIPNLLIITTATLTLTFDDTPLPAPNCSGSWHMGTDAGAPRTRSSFFPNGSKVKNMSACCTLCASATDCIGYVFDDTLLMCYPLSSFNGTVAAPHREFGFGSGGGFTRENLAVYSSETKITWSPDSKQVSNLGGTLEHMDCYSTPTQCFNEYNQGLQPGLLAQDGWTLVDDTVNTLRTVPGTDGIRWWALPRSGDIDFYFVSYGSDYRRALATFASVMGPPAIPPRSALGAWWSQNYPWNNMTGSNQSIVTGVLDHYANLSIPLSVLVLDMDWHRRFYDNAPECATWGSFDFNSTAFADPSTFLNWVQSNHGPLGHALATSLNVHPQSNIYHCLERYTQFGQIVGWDTTKNVTIPCDMTNKTWVDALWSVYYNASPLDKVTVFWTDYDGCPGSMPISQQPPSLLWSNIVYAEQRANLNHLRPLTFSRYGGLGNHRTPIGFSGDTFQHELTLDFEITMTKKSANVLFGWWSHDLAGFHADRTDIEGGSCPGDSDPTNITGVELFSRWLQFGALSPIMRTHCGGCGPEGISTCACDRRIWQFPSHFNWMRDAFRLRAAVVPYLYTAARIFYDTAIAPIRSMYIDEPDAVLYAYNSSHQYFFGSDLIVSPIHTFTADGLGNASVSVWLPSGLWSPWDGNSEAVLSDGTLYDTRFYGQSEIPIFVRANALLPFALNGGDDIAETSPAIAWTLWATGANVSSGLGYLYEDDGTTQDFLIDTLTTNASFVWAAHLLTLQVEPAIGSYTNMQLTRDSALNVRGWMTEFASPPTIVHVNGIVVPQSNNEDVTPGWNIVVSQAGSLVSPNGMLQIRAGTTLINQTLIITVGYM